jgi:tetratricopeptide (TPR) repeat protein
MHSAAKTIRFLMDLSSEREFADPKSVISHIGVLQTIVTSRLAHAANSLQLFNDLAQRLIRLCEHTFNLRDMEALQQASLALTNLPIAEVRQIGRYYQAIAISRIGQTDEALSLLEAVADHAPTVYRARAIQTLGSIYHRLGRLDEAVRFYPEAVRLASTEGGRDLLTTLMVHLELSCIKSEIGDHGEALADLEGLSPLVRIVGQQTPLYFYLYQNELAIEFAELGRIAEAEAACAIALASPFAHAYPEWSATRDEIAVKRQSATPSIIAINRRPECERSALAPPQRQTKPSQALAFSWLVSDKTSFQRSIVPKPAIATTALNAISILNRVFICIAPRAPPACR